MIWYVLQDHLRSLHHKGIKPMLCLQQTSTCGPSVFLLLQFFWKLTCRHGDISWKIPAKKAAPSGAATKKGGVKNCEGGHKAGHQFQWLRFNLIRSLTSTVWKRKHDWQPDHLCTASAFVQQGNYQGAWPTVFFTRIVFLKHRWGKD